MIFKVLSNPNHSMNLWFTALDPGQNNTVGIRTVQSYFMATFLVLRIGWDGVLAHQLAGVGILVFPRHAKSCKLQGWGHETWCGREAMGEDSPGGRSFACSSRWKERRVSFSVSSWLCDSFWVNWTNVSVSFSLSVKFIKWFLPTSDSCCMGLKFKCLKSI